MAFAILGSLPYIYAYHHTPKGVVGPGNMIFTGFVGRGVFGLNGYMMLARQAQHGQYLLENLMTPDDVPRVFFNLEWWLFGRMAAWTHLSLVAMFHVWRVATVLFIVCALWYLLRLCLDTPFQRKFALALILTGSGFGWLVFLASKIILFLHPAAQASARDDFNAGYWMHGFLFRIPLDIRGVSFPISMINQPHFVLATAFAVLCYAFLLKGERENRIRYFVLSGIMAVFHMTVRPYNIPETMLIYILFPTLLCIHEGRFSLARVRNYAVAMAFFLPIVLYYAWLSTAHFMGNSTGPNWFPGYFVDQILWLGLPALLVCLWAQGLGQIRSARPSSILLALWLVLAFVIEQAHNYYNSGQEASLPAYMIVPAILAIAVPMRSMYHGLCDNARVRRLVQRLFLTNLSAPATKRAAAILIVLFCVPSSVYAYRMMFASLKDYPAPYYITKDLADGFQWLEKNANTHDTVLASFETSQLVPWMAGIKTFQGHYMITPNSHEKAELAERFFSKPGDDEFKQKLANDYNLHYVIYGPQERHDNGMQPASHPWLKQCFSKGGVTIFKVEMHQAPS